MSRISLVEKIEIIRKYMEEYGQNGNPKIKGDTVYNGYPIGQWGIQIRYDIKKNKHPDLYTEDIINGLAEMGLLEKQAGTVDDAINRLVTFCTKYPHIWHDKSDIELERIILDEEERRKVILECEQAKNDFAYINRRMKLNKLSNEQIQVLKNAGVFPEKDEIDELTEQYVAALKIEHPDFTDETIRVKSSSFNRKLRAQVAQFGGLNNYRQAYIEALATGDNEELSKVLGPETVTMFDTSQEDFIAKYGYTMLLESLEYKPISESKLCVTDSQFIVDNPLKHACGRFSDKERAQNIIVMIYGLDGNGVNTNDSVGEKTGISNARVKQIKESVIMEMKNAKLMRYIEAATLEGKARYAFVKEYFAHHDIFNFSDSSRLTEEVKAELRRIYDEGTRDAVEDLILREQAIEDIKNNNVPSYVFDDNTYLTELNILSRGSIIEMYVKNISTVGDLMKYSTEMLKKLPEKYNDIVRLKELLGKISFKTDLESADLSDEVFDVLNFPGDIEEVLIQHVKPVVDKEGIPFSVADFMMMSDDEISRINCGPKKMEEIKAIRNKLRSHYMDIDVDRIEDSNHEKLVQIVLQQQETIAEQQKQINEMTAKQSSRD